MIIGVVGSRTITDRQWIYNTLRTLPITMIVSGGASGVDTIAIDYAREYGLPYKIFHPDWAKYRGSAGAIRNLLIVRESEHIVAFWDGKSKGTKITIDIAKRESKVLGKSLTVYRRS